MCGARTRALNQASWQTRTRRKRESGVVLSNLGLQQNYPCHRSVRRSVNEPLDLRDAVAQEVEEIKVSRVARAELLGKGRLERPVIAVRGLQLGFAFAHVHYAGCSFIGCVRQNSQCCIRTHSGSLSKQTAAAGRGDGGHRCGPPQPS